MAWICGSVWIRGSVWIPVARSLPWAQLPPLTWSTRELSGPQICPSSIGAQPSGSSGGVHPMSLLSLSWEDYMPPPRGNAMWWRGQDAAHHSPLQSDLRRRWAAPAWPIGTRSLGTRNPSSPKEASDLPQPSQLPCHSLPTPAKSRSGLPVAQT